MKSRLSSVIAPILLCVSSNVSAQAMYVNVKSILTTSDGSYGGCMVNFTPRDAIEDQAGYANGTGAGQCGRAFISLDCDGNYLSSKQSANQLSAAQLALVTGNQIYVVVDNTQKNSGYCTATRIDNLNTP